MGKDWVGRSGAGQVLVRGLDRDRLAFMLLYLLDIGEDRFLCFEPDLFFLGVVIFLERQRSPNAATYLGESCTVITEAGGLIGLPSASTYCHPAWPLRPVGLRGEPTGAPGLVGWRGELEAAAAALSGRGEPELRRLRRGWGAAMVSVCVCDSKCK